MNTMLDGDSRLLITSEELESLASEWEVLHAHVPGRLPFTHPAWHRIWLRHFGASSTPVFLSLRDGEQLVGVMALDMGVGHARQLGDPNVCDYAGLLSLPGYEEPCAEGVLEWLVEDLTPALDLWGVPADMPQRAAFVTAAERWGWSSGEAPEAVCPVATLASTWDEFLAALPKHDRHELRRKLRHLDAAGAVSFESVTAPDAVAAGMDRFLELMHLSRNDKDEFLTPAMEAFFRDVATTFAGLGMIRLSSLRLDGHTVATLLSFENESTEFLYNSGYDPLHGHLAVGLLSKAHAIRDAITRGKQRFDFLRGEEHYKRQLGGVPREVLQMHLRQK